MRILKRMVSVVCLALILVIGVLFSVQNDTAVPLDLLVVQFSKNYVALWVLSAFALGGLLGVGVSAYIIIRLKGELLLLRRRFERNDKELNKLRSQVARIPAIKS